MKKLLLDIETRSRCDLTKAGARRYAVDPSTQITTACWKWTGERVVHSACNIPGLAHLGNSTVANFTAAIAEADRIVAHNIAFDASVIFSTIGPCGLDLNKLDDTMARAQRAALPGGLDALCEALGVQGKSMDGHRLVMATCKPRKDGTFNEDGALFKALLDYNVQDVHCLESVDRMLPPLSPDELEIWRRTWTKNARGLPLDIELCERIAAKRAEIELEIANDLRGFTGGAVTSITQRARIQEWCKSKGVPIPNLQRATVESWLDMEAMPFDVYQVLTILFDSGGSAPTKAQALLDRHVAGTFQDATRYYGARSGRGTSEGVNMFNIARPSGKYDTGEVIKRLAAEPDGKFTNTELSDVLRGAIKAPSGFLIIDSDLSNIELRKSLWLAGDHQKLELLRSGNDLYAATAAAALGIPTLTKKSHPKERQAYKKCFGPDTLVLTKAGWKRIVSVSQGDMVWDGTEWVTHRGLLRQGKKQTLNLLGVEVTESHWFWCGAYWVAARDLGRSEKILRQSLAAALENFPLLDTLWGPLVAACSAYWSAVTAVLLSMACVRKTSSAAARWLVGDARCSRLGAQTPSGTGTRRSPKTTSSQDGCTDVWPLYTIGASTLRTRIFRTTAVAASLFGATGASGASKTDCLQGNAYGTKAAKDLVKDGKRSRSEKFSSCGTYSRLKAITTRILNSTASTIIKATNRAIFASLHAPKTSRTGELSSTCSNSLTEVFDIAECGPRRRFMILSSAGPLLAHNCVLSGGYGVGIDKLFISFKSDKDLPYEYRRDLTYSQVAAIHAGYRDANAPLQMTWKGLGEAMRAALAYRGAIVPACGDKVSFFWRKDEDVLDIILPSGRKILHYKPRINEEGELTFWRAWRGKMLEQRTWGGGILELICQASARDILTATERAIEAELPDVHLILDIYDSVVALAPEDVAHERMGQIVEIMRRVPDWAPGLPLDAEATVTERMEK